MTHPSAPPVAASREDALALKIAVAQGCGLDIKGRRALCNDAEALPEERLPECSCRQSARIAIEALTPAPGNAAGGEGDELDQLRKKVSYAESRFPGDGYCLEDGHSEYLCDISTKLMRFLLDRATPPRAQSTGAGVFDLLPYLRRQRTFSETAFGPGTRAKGIVDHIRKELIEVETEPGDLKEWIDVVTLALDGAWRAGFSPEQITTQLDATLTRNEGRTWPDWRTADPDKAIEHDRAAPATPAGDDVERTRCNHQELQFNSGDYYVTCTKCNATWMRKSRGSRPEYGFDSQGRKIGAAPEEANKNGGHLLSGEKRARDDRGQRLKDELIAIAAMVETHRDEFDASITMNEQRRDWLEKKAAMERRPKTTPARSL